MFACELVSSVIVAARFRRTAGTALGDPMSANNARVAVSGDQESPPPWSSSSLYLRVLGDDRHSHAVWDDTIFSTTHTYEPWIEAVCGQRITSEIGPPEDTTPPCWRCTSRLPADAIHIPWRGTAS